MPRFGTKSLLVVVGVAALWMSSFAGYAMAQDVQMAILFVIEAASVLAALYYRGRRQAFWIGFAVALLYLDFNPTGSSAPRFQWIRPISTSWSAQISEWAGWQAASELTPAEVATGRDQLRMAIFYSIWATCLLALSLVVGTVGACIYEHSRNLEGRAQR